MPPDADGHTRLILIRHAHTDAGPLLCGWFDAPLSPAGCAQLEKLRRSTNAGTGGADALYTSPSQRALQVALALGRRWRLQPVVTDAAREIHCGRLEGMPLCEVQRRYPQLWTWNMAQTDDRFRWPAGETYAAFRARVLSGLGRIAAAHEGRRVAIVTHAGVVSQVLGVIRGRAAAVWSADRPHPFTATEVEWAGGRPRALARYNDPDWF